MPFIEVKILEGVLDDAGHAALIAELTEAVVRVGGEPMRAMTRCVIQEVRTGRWGVAGRPLVAPSPVATGPTPGAPPASR